MFISVILLFTFLQYRVPIGLYRDIVSYMILVMNVRICYYLEAQARQIANVIRPFVFRGIVNAVTY